MSSKTTPITQIPAAVEKDPLLRDIDLKLRLPFLGQMFDEWKDLMDFLYKPLNAAQFHRIELYRSILQDLGVTVSDASNKKEAGHVK